MPNKKLLLTAVAVLGLHLSGYAVMANPEPYQYVQPDGSVITLVKHGDEFAHAVTTEDGRLVTFAADGTAIVGEKPADLSEMLTAKRLKNPRMQQRRAKSAKVSAYPDNLTPQSIEGDIHGLIVLVNFKDKKFTNTQEYVYRQMNEEGFAEDGATGSARDYFLKQSSGKFRPTFDVVGPVDLDKEYSYYGKDIQTDGDDANPEEMIVMAVDNAVKEGMLPNLDAYDRDNDGIVDMVYVIYAGYGQADSDDDDTIWPHMFYISQSDKYRDYEIAGKKLDTYACSSEYKGTGKFSGIGTFCHEYGHCLNLPDLYDTYNAYGYGIANFDVMSSGNYNNDGNTPPNYSSFERYYCGWLDYEDLEDPKSITLEEIGASNKAYRIPTDSQNKFFTIENRQYEGWDKHLPSRGLMICLINYDAELWTYNAVNTSYYGYGVQLIPADNTLSRYSTSGDLYPGLHNNTELTDDSNPSYAKYGFKNFNKPITDIAVDLETGLASFNFKGGSNGGVTAIDGSSFQASVNGDELTVTLGSDSRIDVYSATGMLVATTQGKTGVNTITLPANHGIYIVRTATATTKIIK